MIGNVHSTYNQPSLYNQAGAADSATDFEPIPENLSDTYKRLVYIRHNDTNAQSPVISVNIPLLYTDKINETLVFNNEIPGGATTVWQGSDIGWLTKLEILYGVLKIMNKWNYVPGGGTGYDFTISFTKGVFELSINKDHSEVNGVAYPVTKGSTANTNVRLLTQFPYKINFDFYNFKIFGSDDKLKYSLYPVIRLADSKLGVYCEQQDTFYAATGFDEPGPVIE